MLDRRRRKKGYGVVPQGEGEGEDVELGEQGSSGQENGVVSESWDERGLEEASEPVLPGSSASAGRVEGITGKN